MKYPVSLCLLLLIACGRHRHDETTRLTSEQKLLKDSANTIREKIGSYLQQGLADSVTVEQKQLGAVYTRLKAIQRSIDKLEKTKQ